MVRPLTTRVSRTSMRSRSEGRRDDRCCSTHFVVIAMTLPEFRSARKAEVPMGAGARDHPTARLVNWELFGANPYRPRLVQGVVADGQHQAGLRHGSLLAGPVRRRYRGRGTSV